MVKRWLGFWQSSGNGIRRGLQTASLQCQAMRAKCLFLLELRVVSVRRWLARHRASLPPTLALPIVPPPEGALP